MVVKMGVDLSKGLLLMKLIESEKSISYFNLKRNSGFSNLQKFPWKLKKITRVESGQWKDMGDFKSWLKDSFGGGHYPEGQYYLVAFRDSLKYKKIGYKKYKKIRPFEPFAKFLIRSDGGVEMPDDFRKSARTGKMQRVYLLLKQVDEREEMMRQLKQHRKIIRR
jgi:hypothetical protein